MNGRKVGVALATVVMAVSGWYVFVYLYRWEWNRAIVAGIIFLAAEVGLLGAALLDRLSKLGHRMDELDRRDAATEERVLRQLRAHPSEPTKPFAWMDGTRSNVFIPVLLGAGAVLSALAWVVDRIAPRRPVRHSTRGWPTSSLLSIPCPAASSARPRPTRSDPDEAAGDRRGGDRCGSHRREPAERPHAEPP